MTDEDLEENLFGERPYAECLLARIDSVPVGFALFFPTYSTFEGRQVFTLRIYLFYPSTEVKEPE